MTATSSCSSLLVTRSSSSGIIFSNRNGLYNNVMNCQWQLSSTANLELRFFRFSTEANYDFVYVYDGGSTSSPLIGNFHGSSLPAAITSSRKKLFVRFTTDSSGRNSGFAAVYHGKNLGIRIIRMSYHLQELSVSQISVRVRGKFQRHELFVY